MKCLSCGGEWISPVNISVSLDNCPFCGCTILNVERAKSYVSLSTFLQYIVSVYGIIIYNNKQKLDNLIADLYTGEKRMKRIYHRAIIDDNLSQHIYELSLKPLSEREIYYNYIIFKYINDNYLQPIIGKQIINEFISGLSLDIKVSYIMENTEALNYWIDEFGAKYSKDKKVLIKGVNIEFYMIKNGTMIIGKNAFKDSFELIDIEIPNSVIRIEEEAFSYCKNLESIQIPNSVIYIGDGVFDSCESLTNIELPDSIIHIGIWAFAGCKNLTNVRLSKSITAIREGTFAYCEKLHQINIPNLVDFVEKSTFEEDICI